MLGHGALGEYPLAEYGWAGNGVSLSLPFVTASASNLSIEVAAGRHIGLPPATVTVSALVAKPLAGRSLNFQRAAIAAGARTPTMGFGATVGLPAVALTAASLTPTIRSGANAGLPSASVTLSSPNIGVRAGKWFGFPPANLNASTPMPNLGFGSAIGFEPVTLELQAKTISTQAGRVINLADTFSVSTSIGALGENALGSFAIGDGEPVSFNYTRPVTLRLTPANLTIRLGKNIDVPPALITSIPKSPEINARSRKVRVIVSAS